MKKLLFLVLIINITLVGAVEKSECDKTFYFIIEGNDRISDLKSILNTSLEQTEILLKNYSDICPQVNNKHLPKKVEGQETLNENRTEQCEIFFDKPVLWGSYNLNHTVGKSLPAFYLENKTCEDLQDIKLFFNVEKESESFKIEGIRTWWIFVVLLAIPIIIIIRNNFLVNRSVIKELGK